MEQDKTIKTGELIKIIRRRKWGLIIPMLVVLSLSIGLILVWKPVYRSTSTILIEEQEIPREYVMATVTSYAEQRLQAINQRIMSASRLTEIINRFNLYADKRNRLTTEEIIENMRKNDIRFDTVMADVLDRRTGQKTEATIAFTLSYEGKNPAVVQQVANMLASFYLAENIKVMGQQTAGTTKFLEEEMNSVQGKLAELEKRISVYKERNPHALPELLQFNLHTLDWSERNYDQLNDQLRSYREKESYLQTQLATIAPDAANQDKERLKELRVLLGSLSARYSAEYPDVVKTKLELAELEKKIKAQGDRPETAVEKPDNPAYVALAAELASVRSEIKSLRQQIVDLDKKRNTYRQRLEQSPRVEEGYRNLVAERNNTQAKYDDLMKKFMESKVAKGLEKEQMGERFTLIDPARLPEKPVRPNRLGILLLALVLGFGAGVGTVSMQEANDHSVRRSDDLMALGFPVLADIPEIVSSEDELRKRKRFKIVFGISLLPLVALVLGVHFFVMDLDVLWARVIRYLAF